MISLRFAPFPVILCAGLLASCGGDSFGFPDEAADLPAEGIYAGTVTGSTSGATAFQALVLENDDVWALYGQTTGALFSVHGFVQGNGASASGGYSSSNARDFGFIPAAAASLTAAYNGAARTISGNFQAPGAAVQFTGGPVQGITYNYDVAASLPAVAGSWNIGSLQEDTLALTIAADGAIAFTGSTGCNGTGTLSPRTSGKNVFNVSLTFGSATTCALPGETATGIAIAYNIPGSSQQQLTAAVVNADRTLGTAVFGVR